MIFTLPWTGAIEESQQENDADDDTSGCRNRSSRRDVSCPRAGQRAEANTGAEPWCGPKKVSAAGTAEWMTLRKPCVSSLGVGPQSVGIIIRSPTYMMPRDSADDEIPNGCRAGPFRRDVSKNRPTGLRRSRVRNLDGGKEKKGYQPPRRLSNPLKTMGIFADDEAPNGCRAGPSRRDVSCRGTGQQGWGAKGSGQGLKDETW